MALFLMTASEWGAMIFDVVKTISFVDIIDILIVSLLLYYLIRFVRDRRAGRLAVGVILLIALQLVSGLLDMYLLQYILQNIFQVGIIMLVILFQPELRSVLEKVGATPLKGLKSINEARDNSSAAQVIDSIVSATVNLSDSRTGALIVIERSTKLGDMILTGTVIDAYPATELIKNIFWDKAPMHDGAVIIRDYRLYAAGCFLPLSNNPDIIKDLGTRHRAAIGMSEVSDAVVIIVSEETGVISTALEGKLIRKYNAQSLTAFLKKNLIGEENGDKKKFPLLRKTKKDTETK